MKKVLLSLCLLFSTLSAHALSDDALQLKDKLAVFKQINANFLQRVSNAQGKLLNESRGEMTILRPGKFHWQVQMPEEELIVSDGKTIWYYSPFIEQVTLINFSDAITNTPFALLAGASDEQWENYTVRQQEQQFIVSNANAAQSTTFIFEFDSSDNISKFVVIEALGQRSEFLLTHINEQKVVTDALFDFQIPADVEVDDQR